MSVNRLAETAIVHFLTAIVFIVQLVSTTRQDTLGVHYWWLTSVNAACILSGTAFCIWYLACNSSSIILFQLWQITVALFLTLTEATTLWRAVGPISDTKMIAKCACGVELLLAPGGLYLYLKGSSEVLWALALPSHVGMFLLACIPLYKKCTGQIDRSSGNGSYRDNWKGAGKLFAVILVSISLLMWSGLSGPSVGQYAAHNGVAFTAIAMRWELPIKALLRRKPDASDTNRSNGVQTRRSTAVSERVGGLCLERFDSEATLVPSPPDTG